MTELFDAGELYPLDDPRNPFFGLGGFDEKTVIPPDPMERIEREVLDALGIQSFDEILITGSERTLENARGNRFENIKEALVYLFDAGILQFSGVVIGAEEIEIEIESDTGRSSRGR